MIPTTIITVQFLLAADFWPPVPAQQALVLSFCQPPRPSQYRPMKYIFFQGQFCAHCGNQLTARSWWRPRSLCDRCEEARRWRRRLTMLLILPGLVLGGMLIRRLPPPAVPRPRPVSALDATPEQSLAQPGPDEESADAERVFCGALTKKGTPCRRLVRPGERCPQHRGR